MKINRIVVAVSILVVVFGSVALSQNLGWWQTKNSGGGRGHESEKSESESHVDEGKNIASDDRDVIENTEDVKVHGSTTEVTGSFTIKNALDMGLSQEQIIGVLGEYDDESQLIKDVATVNGLSFGKAKTALNDLMN
ncbi:MAG: hypothetical protein KAQ68_06840 [Clostridiales bacterium]|nr:hypothetical protein [Clostridiales bacterium]